MSNLGFCEVLGLVLVVLKLTEVITWSWWLVLAPLYVPLLVTFVLYCLCLMKWS